VGVDGLDVHLLEAGAGRAIVLLHGGTATAEMSWETAIPLLVEHGFHVIAPDTRGHGRTANPTTRLTYDLLADDVAGLVDALGLDRPVIAGYSDGAQIALEFGLRHPGRAAALVLGGAMSEPTSTYVDGLHEWGFVAPGEVDLDRIAVEFGDDLAELRAAHLHATDDEAWVRFLRQIAELWLTLPAYRDDQLATIADPTLVITGDCDELADLNQAARLQRTIPDAELAVVPGAGHGCADREVYWALVLDFIARRRPEPAATHT
jgi:pimeloyl-ACP methyl ester carboxylesterase